MAIWCLVFHSICTIFAMMKLHAPLLPLAACLMIGIMLSVVLNHWTTGLMVLVPAVLVVSLLRHFPRLQTVGIGCCAILVGMTLGARTQQLSDGRLEKSTISIHAENIRQKLLENYHEWGISDEAFGVVAAMTLGEKSKIDKPLKETYSKVGAAHVLALSGLHLMIIYGVISFFFGWRRIRILSQIIIILAIWTFALLVGMSPSVVRSAVMITVYALLSLGYRERMSVNTLAFTAIVMLIVNPLSLYDIGFQLSFMAVLAILLFYPLFARLIPLHVLQRYRWLNMLWGMTTVSLSAQIGTAPLIAYYFGHFSTWFLLSNFIVIPLATAILYLAVLCFATCWLTPVLHGLTAALSWVVVFMNNALETIASLPYSSIEDIHLSALQVAFLYIIIGSTYVLLSLRINNKGQSKLKAIS